ncbi:hypothetical protein C8Q76DRAFT_706565, partial [Earliella scabrosa]
PAATAHDPRRHNPSLPFSLTEEPATMPTQPRLSKKRKADEVAAEDRLLQGSRLRHLVHTRVVVKEICLPLTAFTSSQQLVKIVYHCVLAHEEAWKSCNYVHRDVSAGNLLIYPTVLRTDDGQYVVYWTGILSDWELGKCNTTKIAMQPERTGTWHFMSAYLLDNPGAQNTIPDELEAFLHVIIYCAARFVPSTVQNVDPFIYAYFEGFSVDPNTNKGACPEAKRRAIMESAVLRAASVDVKFYAKSAADASKHPLNALITKLLRLFHSRYVILRYQQSTITTCPQTPARPSATATTSRHLLYTAIERRGGHQTQRNVEAGQSKTVRRREAVNTVKTVNAGRQAPDIVSSIQVPTDQMFDDLKSLESHLAVRTLLDDYLCEPPMPWPDGDVVPDRWMKGRPAPPVAAIKQTKKARHQLPSQPAAGPSTQPVASSSTPPATGSRSDSGPMTRSRRAALGPTMAGQGTGALDAGNAHGAGLPAAAAVASAENNGRRVTRSQSRASITQAMGQGSGLTTTATNDGGVTRGRGGRNTVGASTGRRLTRNGTAGSTSSTAQSRGQSGGRGRATRATRGRARRA